MQAGIFTLSLLLTWEINSNDSSLASLARPDEMGNHLSC